MHEPPLQPCSSLVCNCGPYYSIVSDSVSALQLAGAEAGKPACMALLSALEAGRQPRLAMQVLLSLVCQLWVLKVQLFHTWLVAHLGLRIEASAIIGAESIDCV